MRNKAEQYRRRARLCLEVARTLSPGRQRLMDRATLIDMAQTWLRLAQEEKKEQENSPLGVGGLEVVQKQQQFQIDKQDQPASAAAVATAVTADVVRPYQSRASRRPSHSHTTGTQCSA